MAEWGRRVFGGALLGAALGVAVGLLLARWLWPPVVPVATPTAAPPPPTVATPAEEEVQEEALLVIAALYALDGDATRAQERLSALGLDDPAAAVGELALRQAAAGNEQVATDLATLAAALGRESAELLAYVATATPTATPTPTVTPTATPTPTFTPTPTPTPTATPSPRPTHRPAAKPPTATAAPPPRPTPLELEWDYRASMLSPPVKLVEAQVAPGERYWKLVKMEWRKPSEGGNTLIYISTLDEYGRPLYGQPVVIEHGPQEVVYTQPGADYGANYPMANTLNSYIVFIGGELPSDRVTGLGLGEWYGGMDHTSFILVFQRTRK